MARSEHIFGPYVSSPRNPLLTHKHVHRTYPIQNVGHADIVETQNGEWYMVCLGSRPKGGFYDGYNTQYSFGGYYRNMGRETFLVPMVWEDDWGPIVSPKTGLVEEKFPVPNLEEHRFMAADACSHFNGTELEPFWCGIRDQELSYVSFNKDRPGFLRFYMQKANITEDDKVSFLGRRQTSWDFSASTKMEVQWKHIGEQAGITTYFNYKSHTRLFLEKEKDGVYLTLIRRQDEEEEIIEKIKADTTSIYLKVEGHEQAYSFYYAIEPMKWKAIGEVVDGKNLSADLADGHTGSFVGLYTTSNGKETDNYADFEYFDYRNM